MTNKINESYTVDLEPDAYCQAMARLLDVNPLQVIGGTLSMSAAQATASDADRRRMADVLEPFINSNPSVMFGLHVGAQLLSYALSAVPPDRRADVLMSVAVTTLLTTDIRAASVALADAGMAPPAGTPIPPAP